MAAAGYISCNSNPPKATVQKILKKNLERELLQQLINDAQSLDSFTRKKIVVALSKELITSEVIEMFLNAFKVNRWNIRVNAISILAQIGTAVPSITPRLVGTLQDKNKYVRFCSAACLIKLEQVSPEVMTILLSSFQDKDHDLSHIAAETLGQVKHMSPNIAQVFITALQDKRVEMRCHGAMGLKEADVPEAISGLLTACKDDSAKVRLKAVTGLMQAKIMIPEVIDELICRLEDKNNDVSHAAAVGLIQLGAPLYKAIIQQRLMKILKDNKITVRLHAAAVLVRFGNPDPEAVTVLENAFESQLPPLCNLITTSLIQVNTVTPSAIQSVQKFLVRRNKLVRIMASINLAQLGMVSPAIISLLIRGTKHANHTIRLYSIVGLSQLTIKEEKSRIRILKAIDLCLLDRNKDVRALSMQSIRKLVEGYPLPGYKWKSIADTQRQRRRLLTLMWWVAMIACVGIIAVVLSYMEFSNQLQKIVVLIIGVFGFIASLAQITGKPIRNPMEKN